MDLKNQRAFILQLTPPHAVEVDTAVNIRKSMCQGPAVEAAPAAVQVDLHQAVLHDPG